MAKLRMKIVRCKLCDEVYEKLVDMDKEKHYCECSGELEVVWRPECPMPLKASYYDGNNRFAEEKEWAKLDKVRAEEGQNMDIKQYKEIKKEQKKIRQTRTKDQRFNNR